MRYLTILLIFVPLAILAQLSGIDRRAVFVLSALGIVPLSWILGLATEELAKRTGPRMGGLLNATLGNAAELIIATFALRQGLVELAKASITGSILGNVLLVLGLSVLLGGIKNGLQRFDRSQAGLCATMMSLAIIALVIPAFFSQATGGTWLKVEELSVGVAAIMITMYVLSLIYSLRTAAPSVQEKAIWTTRRATLLLGGSAVLIAWLSEILVGSVEPVVRSWGTTEFFIGLIIVPLVGNAAEHLAGVQMAWKNKMDLSLAISFGSSMQVALFVAPLLVFLSLFLAPQPLTLVFVQPELISLCAAVVIAALVSLDGESNWLEGAQLLAVYAMLAIAFFLL